MRSPLAIATLLVGLLFALLLSACSGNAADPGTLVVLSHAPSGEVRFMQIGSGKVTERVVVGGEPAQVVRDLSRGRVYVTDRAGDSVAVVDVVAHALVKRIPVGREPHFAALAPDGKRLYVAVTGEGVLAIVDLESLETVARVPTGNRPMGVAVSTDGARVYVANDADETIAVIDPGERRRALRPIPVPGGVYGGLTLSTDGATLLSGTIGRPAIAALTLSNRELREIPLGEAARGARAADVIYATPDGATWLVGLAGSDIVVAVPVDGSTPTAIKTGAHPSGFAAAPGGRVLVSARDGEDLIELDLATRKVTRRIRLGQGYTDVAVFSKSALEALRGQ